MRSGTGFAQTAVVRLAQSSLLALAMLLGGTAAAHGEVRQRAVVAAGSRGDASVRVGERVLWRASNPSTRVVSDVVWSRAGDAVAFATRDRVGHMRLVVVMVGGDAHGQAVSWAVPPRAINVSRPSVIWLDARRVSLGASELQPTLVASWTIALR
jgi:hypothetical protein